MKLLAIEVSRVTRLFRMTRPSGQPYLPHYVTHLAERYHFSRSPQSFEELGGSKVVFQHGLFDGSAIETLEVYNDGIVVTSKSDSDLIDKFLDDMSVYLDENMGISLIKTHIVNKLYESVLVVETDRDIFKPFAAYSGMARMMEIALRDLCGLEVKYHNFGFGLSADEAQNPALKPTPFRFERKIGVEYSLNQFHTAAPLKTKQHLEILENLEQLA